MNCVLECGATQITIILITIILPIKCNCNIVWDIFFIKLQIITFDSCGQLLKFFKIISSLQSQLVILNYNKYACHDINFVLRALNAATLHGYTVSI
jgi:hypothetical protein